MEGIGQGELKISGIPCIGPPFFLWINQGFNRHGQMKVGVWVSDEEEKVLQVGVPVILEHIKEGTAPIFCGVVKKSIAGKEKGQSCLYIEAETASSLLDQKKRNRSFQRQGRSYQELIGEISATYQGYPVWKKGAGGEQSCGFLLQYEETDWELMKRAVSILGNSILPECRFFGNGFYIGLPDGQRESEVKSDHYSIKQYIPGSVLNDGTLCTGPEYVIKDCLQTLYPGERVRFRGQFLAVADKESRLEGGLLKNTYTLRREDAFQTARIYNYQQIGASIVGTVTESSPDKSRLNLSTDGDGESADSWHSRPIFYSGGGAGYSGRPEVGDTMYLYFPSENEESRSVIAGGGAGYKTLHSITQQVMNDTATEEEEAKKSQPLPMGVENREMQENQEMPETVQSMTAASQQPATGKTKTASASNMPGYKNWSTPKKQGVSLNPGGIRLQTGSKTAIGMGNGGISLTSKGDAALKGKNGIEVEMLCGKQVILKANEYIYIQCGMSAAALLPEEIHIKGTRVQLDSPLNEQEETVFGDNALKELKAMYFEAKWGSPMQLFMPDGTPIGREYGLEENEALKKYFLDHVFGTEGYEEYLSTPELQQLYHEGVLDDEGEKLYNDHLYSKWLTETYGKTEWQKFKDWVTTKEGMHTSLDVIGILLEPADALNAVLYLMEKDWGNAALSGISMLPFMGEQFGKAGKGTKKYLLKAADATKLNRNEKFVKMLDNLDIFIKARKADIEDIRRWMRSLDNLADGGDYVIEYVTPDGLIYKVRMNADFRVNINLMDESGDTLQDTLRVGKRIEPFNPHKLKSQSDLTKDYFDSLSNEGFLKGGGRSGGILPLEGKPNSYYVTDKGHVVIYGEDGKRVIDISPERIKIEKYNVNPKDPSKGSWSSRKLKDSEGKVNKTEQWILDYFGI